MIIIRKEGGINPRPGDKSIKCEFRIKGMSNLEQLVVGTLVGLLGICYFYIICAVPFYTKPFHSQDLKVNSPN